MKLLVDGAEKVLVGGRGYYVFDSDYSGETGAGQASSI